MLQAFARPNRTLTISLLVLSGALASLAALLGVADNPPGILLALLACMGGVAAFAHPSRTVDQFWRLAFYSALGLLLFAALHIAFDGLAHYRTGTFSTYALQALAAASFLAAILVCPASFLVGIIGALVAFIRSRRHRPGAVV